MDTNLLREHLAALHHELSNAGTVDEDSRRLLGDLGADIRRLMEASPAAPQAAGSAGSRADAPLASDARPSDEYGSISDRLERIAVQFEVDHPTLAVSSRRLVDLLGKAGL